MVQVLDVAKELLLILLDLAIAYEKSLILEMDPKVKKAEMT